RLCSREVFFYVPLYRGGYVSGGEFGRKGAGKTQKKTFRLFFFENGQAEPLPPKPAEPLPRENAEQLFRRLLASENPPANACYVLAVMLERKRVLKQVTERNENGRVLIYEQPSTGDVFVVPDPELRLDE